MLFVAPSPISGDIRDLSPFSCACFLARRRPHNSRCWTRVHRRVGGSVPCTGVSQPRLPRSLRVTCGKSFILLVNKLASLKRNRSPVCPVHPPKVHGRHSALLAAAAAAEDILRALLYVQACQTRDDQRACHCQIKKHQALGRVPAAGRAQRCYRSHPSQNIHISSIRQLLFGDRAVFRFPHRSRRRHRSRGPSHPPPFKPQCLSCLSLSAAPSVQDRPCATLPYISIPLNTGRSQSRRSPLVPLCRASLPRPTRDSSKHPIKPSAAASSSAFVAILI